MLKFWMKCFIIIFTLFVSISVNAQSTDRITKQCKPPNVSVFASILADSRGDIVHTPCPSRSSIFNGNVDFSGAVVTGVVTGTGTVNFIPRWTAASVLGNTPFSWNGTSYAFNNTALNATFLTSFTPSATVGVFNVGDSNTFFNITQSTNTISNQLAPATGVWNVTDATNFSTVFNANTDVFSIINTTSDNRIQFTSTAAGSLLLGDCTTTINDCIQQLYGSGNTSITAANSIKLQDTTGTNFAELNTAGALFNVAADNGITLRSVGTISIGDVLGDVNGTLFQVIDISHTFNFGEQNGQGIFDLTDVKRFNIKRILTPAGTTGNQTINNASRFSVNFAAAAPTLTVTSNEILTTSGIVCQVMTADATMFTVQVVAGAGSAVLTARPNVPTAETKVYCQIDN